MQTKRDVKNTHSYRHTLTRSGERRGTNLTRNTSKDRTDFHTHITNAKIQTKGSAKDKHNYRHTLTRSGVRGKHLTRSTSKARTDFYTHNKCKNANEWTCEGHT